MDQEREDFADAEPRLSEPRWLRIPVAVGLVLLICVPVPSLLFVVGALIFGLRQQDPR